MKDSFKQVFVFIGFIFLNLLIVFSPIQVVKAQEPCVDCHTENPEMIEAGKPVTKATLDALNPIKQFSEHPDKLSTPGGIISFFLADFAFYLAGLILFVMLVWGGFEMMMGAADKKSLDAGKQRVTAALIGFLILFAVFWLARILELMFGIEILFS